MHSNQPPAASRSVHRMVRIGIVLGAAALSSGAAEQTSRATPATMVRGCDDTLCATQRSVRVDSAVPGPRMHGISQYSLSNGLTILLVRDSSVAVTTVSVTYRVGSRNESQEESGIAHLLEHLLFRGTPLHPALTQELARRGARYNASTTQDRTTYYETFPASAENLVWALDIEADRMVNGTMAERDMPAERTIVQREIDRAVSDPSRYVREQLTATAFARHPYGRPVAGTLADLDRIRMPRVRSFYRRHYHPGNAVLMIAGRFSERDAVREAARVFGRIPVRRADSDTVDAIAAEPAQEGERRLLLRRPGEAARLLVGYHTPATAHPDAAALEVLAAVLTDRQLGFVTQAASSVADVSASVWPAHDPSLLSLSASVRDGASVDSVLTIVTRALDSASHVVPSEAAVSRARNALVGAMDLATTPRLAFAAILSDWVGTGDWRLYYLHRDRLARVSVEDVRRVAARYLQPSNRTVAVVIPQPFVANVAIPSAASLAASFDTLQTRAATDLAQRIESRGSSGVDRAGDVTWDGTPERLNDALIVDTLSNGIRLATLPSSGGGAVSIRVLVRYGSPALLEGKTAIENVLGMVHLRGPASMSPSAYDDLKNRLQMSLGVGRGPGNAELRIEAKRDSIAAVLRVAGETVRNPQLDSATVAQMREQLRSSAAFASGNQTLVARAVLQQQLLRVSPTHPAFPAATAAERIAGLEAVRASQVADMRRELWAPSATVIVVTGDFARDSVRRAVREAFGSWKNSAPAPIPISAPYVPTQATRISVPISGKRDAVFLAGLLVPLDSEADDYPALQIAAHIIGSGSTTSRLGKRIREQAGLSYVARASLETSARGANSFVVTANASPDSLQRIEQLVRDELANVLRDGFTEDEIARAKDELAAGWRSFIGEPRQVASYLADLLSAGRSFTTQIGAQQRIGKVTVADANGAARRYIDPARLVVVRVGPIAP